MFNKLVRNRATEKDLREWLSQAGYYGQTAKILQLELVAIKRPGFHQVFRFEVTAKPKGDKLPGEPNIDEYEKLFGVLREDERFNLFEANLFNESELRDAKLEQWSEGLIVQRKSSRRV